jgi:hypothetical protein
LTGASFQDPLGVAVYRTFGIGLGFNFDHTSKLGKGEAPSTRRLQARAAKSAVRRAREIFDAAAARDEVDRINDPAERERRASQLRMEANEEINTLKRRLTDYIPTDLSLDDQTNTRIQQYAPKDFVRTSSNEYVVQSPRHYSEVIQNLLDEQYRGIHSPEKTKLGEESDDGFIEEYLKSSESTLDSDDESGTKTVLA